MVFKEGVQYLEFGSMADEPPIEREQGNLATMCRDHEASVSQAIQSGKAIEQDRKKIQPPPCEVCIERGELAGARCLRSLQRRGVGERSTE
jgi:hypothetical protein